MLLCHFEIALLSSDNGAINFTCSDSGGRETFLKRQRVRVHCYKIAKPCEMPANKNSPPLYVAAVFRSLNSRTRTEIEKVRQVDSRYFLNLRASKKVLILYLYSIPFVRAQRKTFITLRVVSRLVSKGSGVAFFVAYACSASD